MRFVQNSAAKLNLSLRVTSRRGDGYHDIVSLFLRLPSAETLLISEANAKDIVRVRGLDIEGENIVARALRLARDAGFDVPFFNVEILKTLYPGSGLGAGSGNAAALLNGLAGTRGNNNDLWRQVALKTGADVPFLFSGHPLALVSGIGEIVEPLDPLPLHVWVVFPSWSVGTENAYGQLDRRYGAAYPLDDGRARDEAEILCQALRAKKYKGLLPNDFAPGLLDKFPDYERLFKGFETAGSCAWGITGSGGAAFALFYDSPPPYAFVWPEWTKQVLSLQIGA